MYRFRASLAKDLHIGGLRIALLNYIGARQAKEPFLIRIEDNAQAHTPEGKDQEILEILAMFGIRYDQLLYQSDHLKFHRQFATKLLMEKKAFACFCTPQILQAKQEAARKADIPYRYDGVCRTLSDAEVLSCEAPFVVRLKKPEEPIEFEDMILGKISLGPDDIDDFVIMHVDKTPTDIFASALDDMMYDVSTLFCDETDLADTAREILIHRYIGYDKTIRYAHLPAMYDSSDSKFSIRQLLEEGFLPEAIANYLIGTAIEAPAEIFTLEEAIAWFDPKKLTKKASRFDIDTLRRLNREHIVRMDARILSTRIGYSSEDIGELAKLYTEEASTLQEIKAKIDTIFAPKSCTEQTEVFEKLKEIAKSAPFFKDFNDFQSYLATESRLEGEQLFKPLYLLLTGEQSGPDLSDLYPYIRNYLGEIIK